MTRTFALALFAVLAAPALAPADDAPKPKAPAEAVQGTWLFDEAALKKQSELGRVWESVVTVKGDAFALSQLMGSKNDLKGTLVFDPTNPQAVDLKVAELDLSELLPDYKVPAGTLPAIYKLDGDRLTLCFPTTYRGKRPTAFAASADAYLVTLVRAPKDFKEFPKEIKVTVVGADGKPVAGADVGTFMVSRQDPKGRDSHREWRYHEPTKTGPDGTAKSAFNAPPTVVRDATTRHIAFPAPSPAQLAGGELHVALTPEHRVTGRVVIEGSGKADVPPGAAHVYLLRDGGRIAQIDLKGGGFDFPVVPGTYTVRAFGYDLHDDAATVIVPADKAEVAAGPLALKPSVFALLKGKPAPELEGIVGWKGDKVKLADLKGKYVLVEFWGYWCGPCVGSMPVLIELHEKFADKGLAIVGVHMDLDGEVDTTAKLDVKLVSVKKDLWKGKDMPFPSALVSGTRVGTGDDAKRGGPIAQYGVQSYPTTILIDREGKVVGKFHAREIKSASSEIENLLNLKK